MDRDACFVAQSNAGVLIVQRFALPADAGAFAAAQRVASFISLGGILITMTLTPRIAAAHARGDRQLVARLVRMTASFTVAFGTVIALGALLGSQPLMASFGPEFAARSHLLYALVLAAWIACWGQGVFNGLSMTGMERPLAGVSTALTISFFVLTYWGTRTSGAAGAAAAAIVNAGLSLLAFFTLYHLRGRTQLRSRQAEA